MTHRAGLVVAALFAAASAVAEAQSLSADDKSAIEGLSASYAKALAGCQAEEFADLFGPDTGSFASGFRGRMVGREKLILLVQSERHCTGALPDRLAVAREVEHARGTESALALC